VRKEKAKSLFFFICGIVVQPVGQLFCIHSLKEWPGGGGRFKLLIYTSVGICEGNMLFNYMV
jgi:hypothetical protein